MDHSASSFQKSGRRLFAITITMTVYLMVLISHFWTTVTSLSTWIAKLSDFSSSSWMKGSGHPIDKERLGRYMHRPLLGQYEFSFRLLILYSGKAGEPLCGQLITKEFEKRDINQRYEALSYVWGEKAARNSITLFGKDFSITKSLHEALQSIRSESSNLTLWVDAICINQGDPSERAQQVAMMGDIYKCASGVTNWLGPSTPNAAFGIKFLALLFGEIDLDSEPPWTLHKASAIRQGLKDILQREYFQRSWVVQENALASKVTLKAGFSKMAWKRGTETYRAICRIKFAVVSPSWEAAGLQDIDFQPLLEILDQSMMISRREMNKSCREVTVLDIVYDMRHRKATDNRDKLFAWRSLLPEEMQRYLVVDYSKSVDELYAELFREVKRAYMEEMKFVELSERERLKKERYRGGEGWSGW